MAETRSFEPIVRPVVPALSDATLGEPFRVLDDGFVRVVDYMGDEAAIVQAARVSYGTGTKRVHEDRALIRYLMRHRHTTPFEMCEIKLHVRVPMDCWRQWIRHRTANINEYSTRYSIAIDAAQTHRAGEWRIAGRKPSGQRRRRRPRGGASCPRRRGVAGPGRGRLRAAAPARHRPRAGAQGSSALHLHRGLLEGSTCTICCISSTCAWTVTRSRKSAATPRPSASRSVPRVPIAWEAFHYLAPGHPALARRVGHYCGHCVGEVRRRRRGSPKTRAGRRATIARPAQVEPRAGRVRGQARRTRPPAALA